MCILCKSQFLFSYSWCLENLVTEEWMVKLVTKKKPTCIFKETNVLVLMTLVFYTKLPKILQYI